MTRPAPTDPGWARLLAGARRGLERTGGDLDTTVSLAAPSEAERLVVIGVTGVYRSAGASRLTVRLADLDAYLREAHGTGLAELLRATGPLRDRRGEAEREARARAAVLAAAGECRYAGAAWYEEWLAGLRRDGTLTRLVRGGARFGDVVRVLNALPADGEPLPAFADRVLGDTKGLQEPVLRGLVLRALALWQGVPVPAGSERERALWEWAGLVPDDLASQVLVLNVPAEGGLVGTWLGQACAVGVPVRLTLHQLRWAPLRLTCPELFVCENPAVLRAAVDLGPRSRPVVCTEGVPSAAVHALLRLAPGTTVIRWRNDFDWAGVRMTRAALARYPNAVPWRMSEVDYRTAAAATGPVLIGTPAPTDWDPPLADAMRDSGRAVMEERLLPSLLADLAGIDAPDR